MRRFASVAALSLFASVVGCSGTDLASSADDVTDVPSSTVKTQTIGNCWLYATGAWVESLNLAASAADTEQKLDVSEGYWSFWYWYEEITAGDLGLSAQAGIDGGAVVEGGWWGTAAELIARYGWMAEGDFAPGADKTTVAQGHTDAVARLNESLTSGALRSRENRRDHALVLRELARIWNLDDAVASDLKAVFGATGDRNFQNGADAGDTRVRHARDVAALGADGSTRVTLADVVGKRAPDTLAVKGKRVGAHAWSEVPYTWGPDEAGAARRRALQQNIQATMHRRLAVPIAWGVGTAVGGAYEGTQSTYGGLHESVLVDYAVEGVPGFGALPLGEVAKPEAQEAALAPEARITRFRVKNSWGADPFYTDEEWRQFGNGAPKPTEGKESYLPALPGFNDLDIAYVDSDISVAYPWQTDARMMLAVALPNALQFEVPELVGPRRAFVTHATFAGDLLGGLAGADELCTAAARDAGLEGAYRALLSEHGEDPLARFEGQRVGSYGRQGTYESTVVFALPAHPQVNENGGATTVDAWYGAASATDDPATNCAGWTGGSTGATLAGASVACSSKRALYCVEAPPTE